MGIVLDIESLGNTDLDDISEDEEGEAAKNDSDDGREPVIDTVERQSDEEHRDQG